MFSVVSSCKTEVAHRVAVDLAQMLLRHGADVNSRDADGWTPLMRLMSPRAGSEADQRVRVELAILLLNHGAAWDVAADDHTALSLAQENGLTNCVTLLEECSAARNTKA